MIITKYRINTSWGYREFIQKNAEYNLFLSEEGVSEEIVQDINYSEE